MTIRFVSQISCSSQKLHGDENFYSEIKIFIAFQPCTRSFFSGERDLLTVVKMFYTLMKISK